jgi:Raf kinase inhibitor-like YbhB/YbcL family protein
MPEFKLNSPAFRDRDLIPKENTGEGADVPPILEWKNAPASTEEFVLIVEDPDAVQDSPWIHWLLYKIPASVSRITPQLPEGVRQGLNSFGRSDYGGPFPPEDEPAHRYYFLLYALDTRLDLKEGATKNELWEAMRAHVIAETGLVGKYHREKEIKKAG